MYDRLVDIGKAKIPTELFWISTIDKMSLNKEPNKSDTTVARNLPKASSDVFNTVRIGNSKTDGKIHAKRDAPNALDCSGNIISNNSNG